MNRRLLIISALAIILLTIGLTVVWLGERPEEKDIKVIFEQKYRKCQEWSESHGYLSFPGASEPYMEIIELGPPVLPYAMEKMKEGDFFLDFVVSIITKKDFDKSEWPPGKLGDSRTAAKMFVKWWHEGRKQTPQQFEKLYQEWKDLKKKGKVEEAGERYQRIKDLGIAALPYMIKKIEQGDKKLVPAFSYLIDDAVKKNASTLECVDWWKKNKDKWTLPPIESK
ncbi:MAG: hypothetical protein JSU92_04565 [Deltaproteobacteria bacterium]|nr:MAG: hypothetical protein JSU92_04565 [Deltaproteobacteria bacterium]